MRVLGTREEDRQAWRDQVIGTTADDFIAFADRLDAVAKRGSTCVVASERALAEANQKLPDGSKLEVRQVLE